tara:strand:- start:2208 stop:3254 length:1047 start_codon:yes stop_codon:yes gene_type:complete
MLSVNIENIQISNQTKPVLIAEIGINHEGSLKIAKEMAQLAVENGADIIKHQTHIVEDEMSIEANQFEVDYLKKSIFSLMKECALSKEEEIELKYFVEKELKSLYLSTPFSRSAANFLQQLNLPAFKIGSGECNNYPLVEHIANFGKPILLSTGMNNLQSIDKAVQIIKKKKLPFVLLHTTNSYPCPDKDINLGCITEIKNFFEDDVLVGFSDHSVGSVAIEAAVALGACVIEKHFTDTLSRNGPDIKCSMDPAMCNKISTNIKRVFDMRNSKKNLLKVERSVAEFAYASVCSTKDINPGEKLNPENIWVKRPGTGDFLAEDYNKLFGRLVKNKIPKNTQIKKQDVEN